MRCILVVLTVSSLLVAGGCGGTARVGAPASAPAAAATATPSRACRATVRRGPIPVWARGGFSSAEPRMPHALGRHGRIVALLFGDPLTAPSGRSRQNKILWVARARAQAPGTGDLRIRARRMHGDRPIGPSVPRTVIGGPGPSIIDLPAAGCWRLQLRWGPHADQLDLRYRDRS